MPSKRLPPILHGLSLPVVSAPMFIASNPRLVVEQCKANIVGSFPALNARPAKGSDEKGEAVLDRWLTQIKCELAEHKKQNPTAAVGPIAVNQIVHKTNQRLEADMAVMVEHKVPVCISSLRAPPREVIDAVHKYGGVCFHDVISVRHAQKALEAGVDGLILVCAGAGGHAGILSPIAFVPEIRKFFNGPILLSGCVSTGANVLACQALGADLAYVGTRFLATPEANIVPQYKRSIIDSASKDIVYSPIPTGVHGNYLRSSLEKAGIDPEEKTKDRQSTDFSRHGSSDETMKKFGDPQQTAKPWRDIWSAGQGVANIDDELPVAELVARMRKEYAEARTELLKDMEGYY